ncbi:MAG: prephenate dehydrogenase dimerization domain-containing protein [archaeon]|nr:prephenate dehydrogenase dimerization domain-containing protein [archaeon]
MFTNEGAHLMEITADRHDRAMALVQRLSHVQNMLFTNRIEESEFSMEELGTLSTPVYNIKLDSALRMLAGDPRLPALIQIHNPYCKHLISDIIEIYYMIEKYIEEKDVDGLTEFVSDLKEYVGKYAEDASNRTDKQIGEPRFVAEIYFEKQDIDIMSKIYKGTRNHKELDAALYQKASKRTEDDEFMPDEENDIMTATILVGDVGRFVEQKDIVIASEKKWRMSPYTGCKKTVFYIDKNVDYPGKYQKIAMSSIITKPEKLKKKEEQYNRTIIPMRHITDSDIVSFFHTFNTDKILKENKMPKIVVKYPHKSRKRKAS